MSLEAGKDKLLTKNQASFIIFSFTATKHNLERLSKLVLALFSWLVLTNLLLFYLLPFYLWYESSFLFWLHNQTILYSNTSSTLYRQTLDRLIMLLLFLHPSSISLLLHPHNLLSFSFSVSTLLHTNGIALECLLIICILIVDCLSHWNSLQSIATTISSLLLYPLLQKLTYFYSQIPIYLFYSIFTSFI